MSVNEEWERMYFFVKINNIAECLVCGKRPSRTNKSCLERHYRCCHSSMDKYEGAERDSKFEMLKQLFLHKQKMAERTDVRDGALKASYVISEALAKEGKSFGEASFLKDTFLAILDCFDERGKTMKRAIETIPLSRQTMQKRTEKLSKHVLETIQSSLSECKYFSLALSKSRQILCIRIVQDNFEVLETMGWFVPVGDKIALYTVLQTDIFPFVEKSKLAAICMRSANDLTNYGQRDDLVVWLERNNCRPMVLNCILQQFIQLCQFISASETITSYMQIVENLKSPKAETYNRLKALVEALETEEQTDVPLLSDELKWLSCSKSLKTIFELRAEVAACLEECNSSVVQELVGFIQDTDYLTDLAFYCDLVALLAHVNAQLHEKNVSLCDMAFVIKQFYKRLRLVHEQLQCNNLSNLPTVAQVCNNQINILKITEYMSTIDGIVAEFSRLFADVLEFENVFDIFDNPLTVNAETVRAELHAEVVRLQTDVNAPIGSGIRFWQHLDSSRYPKLKDFMHRYYSMFGSTLLCETCESKKQKLYSKERVKLTNEHAQDLVRIQTYELDIDLDKVIKKEA